MALWGTEQMKNYLLKQTIVWDLKPLYTTDVIEKITTRYRAYMEMVAHVICAHSLRWPPNSLPVMFELTLTVCTGKEFPAE